MTYRIRGGAHLFTWSQVGEDTTLEQVKDKFTDVQRIVLASERHADGGRHIHVYIEWTKRQDRLLDERLYVNGQRPNIKSKRSRAERRSARAYCKKDGDYIEHGFDEDSEEEKGSDKLKKAVEEANGDIGKYIEYVIDAGISHPMLRDYWQAANAAWRRSTIWDDSRVKDRVVSSFTLQTLYFDDQEQRCYVLRGGTGVGKTTWAVRNIPKPALWVRHSDDIRLFREEVHKAILVDDVEYTHTPRPNQLNMCDMYDLATIHVRYGVARIPAGTPRIFTCNPGHDSLDFSDEAIKRRCYVVDC